MQHHAINRSGNSNNVEHPPPHGYSASAKNIVMENAEKGTCQRRQNAAILFDKHG